INTPRGGGAIAPPTPRSLSALAERAQPVKRGAALRFGLAALQTLNDLCDVVVWPAESVAEIVRRCRPALSFLPLMVSVKLPLEVDLIFLPSSFTTTLFTLAVVATWKRMWK